MVLYVIFLLILSMHVIGSWIVMAKKYCQYLLCAANSDGSESIHAASVEFKTSVDFTSSV